MFKILKNILLIFAAFIIVFPAIANFAHIFSGHLHGLCDNYAKEHFHQADLDCKLYKFHQSASLDFKFLSIESLVLTEQINHIFSVYDFLSDYKVLPFELRGPPSLA